MEELQEIILCNSIKEEEASKKAAKAYLEDIIMYFIYSLDEESFKDLKDSINDYDLFSDKVSLRLKNLRIKDLINNKTK